MPKTKCPKCGFKGYPPYYKWKNPQTGDCALCGKDLKTTEKGKPYKSKRAKTLFLAMLSVIVGIFGAYKLLIMLTDLLLSLK